MINEFWNIVLLPSIGTSPLLQTKSGYENNSNNSTINIPLFF